MIVRRLIVPLTLAVFITSVTDTLSQTPFPAPLPHGATGTVNDPAFPPVRGSVDTPNDSPFPPVNGTSAPRTAAPRQDSAFPPVNGTTAAKVGAPAAFPSGGAAPMLGGCGAPPPRQAGPPGGEDCMKEFVPPREAAEKRGKLLQAAGARQAPPDEACTLIGQ